MEIKEVGIVGGGVMGAGIIYTLLSAGCAVRFKELDEHVAEQCLRRIEKIFQSSKKKTMISDDEIKEKMGSIKWAMDYGFFSGSDLVLEAVPERIESKREVFEELDKRCKPSCILATNTSSLSISELGGITQRPSKVIGMHWFNPPHIMKLVEIVPGLETSKDTVEAVFQFCERLQKIPIEVKECAGFLVNRILGSYVNEALFLIEEGYTPPDIDCAAESSGIPMGPIKLGDMVGWDTIHHSNTTLYNEYGSRFALPALLTQIFSERRWGMKSGKGFYRYEGGRIVSEKAPLVSDLEALSTRLLSAMINEGIRCLDEGVASLEDIDTAMKVGAGMPRGPLQWVDTLGLDTLLRSLAALNDRYGERFLPSPLLKRKVAAGHLGQTKGKGFYQY